MGVTSLWQILEPVKQHVPLCSLKGKTLAVDLSLWVCEAQTVKKMMGIVTKPHLRNLYFRVSSLTLMGIHLVFVMEGDPPKLKTSAMQKRTEARFGPSKKPEIARMGRSRFKFLLKECLELLECLGIPWIQAAGEAEAMCAYLNANGYVDGCITNDGDIFLYGAQAVYRNFTMNIKDPHVDCYLISAIEEKLGCSRESLIGLAILLGCDYLPKPLPTLRDFMDQPTPELPVSHHHTQVPQGDAGYQRLFEQYLKESHMLPTSDGVPGVGKEQALKLIKALKGQSLLQRFESWKGHFQSGDIPVSTAKEVVHCSVCHHPGSYKDHEDVGCHLCGSIGYCEPQEADYCCPCDWHSLESGWQQSLVEEGIKKKAKACEGFPFPEVIQEYLISKDKPVKLNGCQRPNLLSFQRFAVKKMDWTKHYACEKLCSLLTYYDMNRKKSGHTDPNQLQALRIIKTRIKNGIPCFEIVWQKPDHYTSATEDQPADPFLITIEESTLFQAAYPKVVALYQMQKLKIGKEKKESKKKPREKECLTGDSKVEDTFSYLNLHSECENIPSQDPKSDFKLVFDLQKFPKKSCESLCLSEPADISTRVGKPCNFLIASQDTENEYKPSNSLLSQTELFAKVPMASSASTDLQLSDIDWEGTSFSISPRNVNLPWYSESESGLCNNSLRQCSPLYSKTANILAQHSDSAQRGPDLVSGVDYSVSNRDFCKEQNDLSLKDQAIVEGLEAFPKAKSVPLLNAIQLQEQIKRTSNSGGEFSSDSTQEIENVMLLEKHLQGLSLENYREDLQSSGDPQSAADKVTDSGSALRLCTEILELTCLENQQILPARSNKVVDNYPTGKKSVPRIMKISLKKSVCQNSYAEDSDSENVMGRRKGHRIPKQQRKSHMVQLKDKCNGKRGNKELAFEIQPEPKGKDEHALNLLNVDLSAKDHLLLPLSKSPSLSKLCGFDPYLQETRNNLNTCESPLPLTERLKLRLQSS